MTYRISLDRFEGPMDLLLYLIKREEVEITEVPILKICDQFLDYVKTMNELDINIAGDFMVMASTLMEIKSRMLLPEEETDEQEEEFDDPRISLVKQLLEYRKFKERTQLLRDNFDKAATRFGRPSISTIQESDKVEKPIELGNIGLFDLFAAYQNLIKHTETPTTTIIDDNISQEKHMFLVIDLVKQKHSIRFEELFPTNASRVYMAGTFISILELAKQKKILIYQGSSFSEIRVTTPEYHRDYISNLESFNRLRDKNITVLGLGRFGGGTSLIRYLAEHGAKVSVSDSGDKAELSKSIQALDDLNITFNFEEHQPKDIEKADIVFVNPAIKPNAKILKTAKDIGVELDADINYFLRHTPAKVMGVTGSNGKTTTTTLLGNMLKLQDNDTLIAGNLGEPFLHRLDYLTDDDSVVLELSSFQLDRLSWMGISPSIAIITNLSPNHLDWHRTMSEYAKAKYNILKYQHKDDLAILNYDDKTLADWGQRCPAQTVFFSCSQAIEGYFLQNNNVILRKNGIDKILFELPSHTLKGKHNLSNIMAAITSAYLSGVSIPKIISAIQNYKPLAHRLENLGTHNNITFINDSKSTTPESMSAACRAFDNNVILLAGGYDKGADFKTAATQAAPHLKYAFLFGDTSHKIGRHLRKAKESENTNTTKIICYEKDLETAFNKAIEIAQANDTILLSPGSASFGLFKDFEERGQAFKNLVNQYRKSNLTPTSSPTNATSLERKNDE